MVALLSSFDPALVLAFVLTFVALNFTPGPAVLKVVSDAVAHGVAPAHVSMAGIFAANLMYAMLAAVGMSALLLAFPVLFETVKWAGVAYLLYLALRMFMTTINNKIATPVVAGKRSPKALFWSSFAVQGGNPKSLLSFGIMLPVFAGEGAGIEMRMMMLALLNVLLEYPALLFYAYVGSTASRYAVKSWSKRLIGVFSALGLGFAATMIARTSIEAR